MQDASETILFPLKYSVSDSLLSFSLGQPDFFSLASCNKCMLYSLHFLLQNRE